MLSNSMFLPGDRQLLEQKVCILEEQLEEYKLKQSKLSKLNESILQSYKFNQTMKQNQENEIKRQNRQLLSKHRQQIRKLKSQFNKDKLHLENQNSMLKQKVKTLQETLERTKIEHEQTLIDIKSTLENKHEKFINEMENKFDQQIKSLNQEFNQMIGELNQQIEGLKYQNSLYQQYIQRKYHLQKENDLKNMNFNKKIGINPYQTQSKMILNPSPWSFKKNGCSSTQSPGYYNLVKSPMTDDQNLPEKYEIKSVPKPPKKLISDLTSRINKAIKEINRDRTNQYR